MGDLVGKRVGNYEILDLLGQGSMGVVFKAMQLSMDRIVALKVLPSKLAHDESYVRRFITEARAAGQITHPNIVAVHDVVKFGDTYAFSMDYVDGSTAQKMIEEEGAISEAEALVVAKQIADALAAAHGKSIIHRDVKPDNIMIDADGTAKLADLGLARMSKPGEPRMTAPGTAIGTPYYMAPEEAKAETIDHRADIYSLGASLFHMLTGRPPFEGPSAASVMVKHATEKVPDPRELNPAISVECSRLIRKLMAKDRKARPSSAEQVVKAIEKVQGSGTRSAAAARRSRTGDTRRRMRSTSTESSSGKNTLPMIIGGVAALVVVVIVLVIFGSSGGGPDPVKKPRNGGVAKETTAEDREAEALARAARHDFLALEKWAEDHPGDLAGQLKRYEEFIDKYPLSADGAIAREKVQGLKRAVAQKRAEEELATLIARAKARAATGRYGDAVELLRERIRGTGPLSSKASDAAEEILAEAKLRYNDLKGEADGLAEAGNFTGAKAKLRPVIRDFNIEELVSAAEAACKDYDRQAEIAAVATEKKTFDEAALAARKLAEVRRYVDAREKLLSLVPQIKSEKLKAEAKVLAQDYDRARKAYSRAQSNLSVGSRTKLALVGLGSRGYIIEMNDSGLKVNKGRGETVMPWHEVTPSSYARVVIQNMSRKDGVDHLHVGVLALLADAWREARDQLTKALALDPTLQEDVERYLAMVAPKLAAAEEKAAKDLFDKAKLNAERHLTVRVASLVKELREDYGHTEFVKSHLEEMNALVGGGPAVGEAAGGAGEPQVDPGDAVALLKKNGWETVEGTWSVKKKDLFVGNGNVKLETPSSWKNAVVSVTAQLEEGDEYHILIRFDEERQSVANDLRGGGGRRGGRRGGMGMTAGSNFDVPQGYGVIVTKDSIKVVDGGSSPFGRFARGFLDGLPRVERTEKFDGTKAHAFLIRAEGESMAIYIDNRHFYRAANKKSESGSVRIHGEGVKLGLSKPLVKQLP